jgi:hypothetical protein
VVAGVTEERLVYKPVLVVVALIKIVRLVIVEVHLDNEI